LAAEKAAGAEHASRRWEAVRSAPRGAAGALLELAGPANPAEHVCAKRGVRVKLVAVSKPRVPGAARALRALPRDRVIVAHRAGADVVARLFEREQHVDARRWV